MARLEGIDPKAFRAALRRENLAWHNYNGSWTVTAGSPEHADLERVLASLASGNSRREPRCSVSIHRPGRSNSDEAWIISLCDEVLGMRALRQHRFPFLLGDPGLTGRRASLPVDAFYPDIKLVVEYHERQHSERVGFFDRRMTVSGMHRGDQRSRYDEVRRKLIPEHGYRLEILDFSEFPHDRAGRLRRLDEDLQIVRERLLS